ncbi:Alpha/Beta hydrolase protein [Melanogaster broomeanus]|nr:Alpha/Beta hydrolase protein [Melanogaster broomeanus]
MTDSSQEKKLALAGGRTLAYATSGNSSSGTVLLYLHGTFTIGETSRVSSVIASKNIHYICPTLPGWGNTSPPHTSTSYVDCLTSDITALLDHLYPDNGRDIKLYISGGSFGTVSAQILYGAPYDKFRYGRCITGVLLMGGISPFYYHKDYAKHMDWSNYFLAGPPTRWLPFKDLFKKFVRELLFDKMDELEKEEYAKWRAKEGIAEGETERRMATNIVRSVATSWAGFRLQPALLHSDWGFRPDALDEEHSRPFVMVVAGAGDKQGPLGWSQYLAATYQNTKLKTVHGGHISVLYHMHDIWEEFLAGVE